MGGYLTLDYPFTINIFFYPFPRDPPKQEFLCSVSIN